MNSEFLRLLDPGDVVLADRGFDIGDDIAIHGISFREECFQLPYTISPDNTPPIWWARDENYSSSHRLLGKKTKLESYGTVYIHRNLALASQA